MSFVSISQRFLPSRPVGSRPFRTVLFALFLVAFLLVACASGGSSGWQRHAPLSEPRTEVAAAVANGSIVAVGGFQSTGANSPRADTYSIAEDRWRRLPDLPLAVDHAAAASANGRVYILGGYGSDRRPLRTAFVLEAGRWRSLAPMPEARAAAAAAVANGVLYVLGGVDGRRGLARVALALDLSTRRWSRLPGPNPREHLAAAATGAGSTHSAVAPQATTRILRCSRSTGLPPVSGRASHPCRRRAAAPAPRPSPVASSPWAGKSPQARSTASSPTAQPPGAGSGWRTSRLRATASASSPIDRVYAVAGGPQPGLTTSGAVESLRVP